MPELIVLFMQRMEPKSGVVESQPAFFLRPPFLNHKVNVGIRRIGGKGIYSMNAILPQYRSEQKKKTKERQKGDLGSLSFILCRKFILCWPLFLH